MRLHLLLISGLGISIDSLYNIASKELHESVFTSENIRQHDTDYFIDDNLCFTFIDGAFNQVTKMYDCNGALLNSFQQGSTRYEYIFFEKGILAIGSDNSTVLLSHSLEKIADIPAPQREAAHGLKEDVKLDYFR